MNSTSVKTYENNRIEYAISMAEESFSERLFNLIKEKEISEVECYKRAGITRQVFRGTLYGIHRISHYPNYL